MLYKILKFKKCVYLIMWWVRTPTTARNNMFLHLITLSPTSFLPVVIGDNTNNGVKSGG